MIIQAQFIRDVTARAEELFLPGRNVTGTFQSGLKVKFRNEDDRAQWISIVNDRFPGSVAAA